MPAKVEATPLAARPVTGRGKPIVARFDGGQLSSDGGVLVAARGRAAARHRRAPRRLHRRSAPAGAGPARARRHPALPHADDRRRLRGRQRRRQPAPRPDLQARARTACPSGAALCSQPTISRLENLPGPRDLLRMGQRHGRRSTAPASARCRGASCWTSTTPSMPSMAGSSCVCSTPTTTNTASSRSSCSTARAAPSPPCCARPGARPGARSRAFLRRLVRAIRGHWPRVEILLRADSHYCTPEVLDFCRAERLDFVLGVASTSTLRRHVETLEQQHRGAPCRRPEAGKLRRYKEFYDGAASWSRVERIIARVEAGAQGIDTRFIVTNLDRRLGAHALPGALLPPRPGGEPHQGLEDATSPPTAPHAAAPPPTSCACSCMPAPIG